MSEMFKVLIADAINAEGLEPLQQAGRFELIERPGLKGEDLARAIEGVVQGESLYSARQVYSRVALRDLSRRGRLRPKTGAAPTTSRVDA